MNHDIFISYSSTDKVAANAICHVLEQNKVRCWIAPRDIPAGAEYGDLIVDAIKHAKVVVIIFSETSSTSSWVKGELNIAFEEQKTLIPFRLDPTPLKGQNRLILANKHWIDAYPDYETKFTDLVNAVKNAIGIGVKTQQEIPGNQSSEEPGYKTQNNCQQKPVEKKDNRKWYNFLFKPFQVYENGVPGRCNKFNVAAFLFPGIWGLFNGVYLLSFISILIIILTYFFLPFLSFFGIPLRLLCGIFGNGWAWKSKTWISEEKFINTQKTWSKYSLIAVVVLMIVLIIAIYHN